MACNLRSKGNQTCHDREKSKKMFGKNRKKILKTKKRVKSSAGDVIPLLKKFEEDQFAGICMLKLPD